MYYYICIDFTFSSDDSNSPRSSTVVEGLDNIDDDCATK